MNKKLLLLTLASLSLTTIMAKNVKDSDDQDMNKSSRSCTTNKHHHHHHHHHHRNPIFAVPVDAAKGAGTVAGDVLEIPGNVGHALFCGHHHNCDQK